MVNVKIQFSDRWRETKVKQHAPYFSETGHKNEVPVHEVFARLEQKQTSTFCDLLTPF